MNNLIYLDNAATTEIDEEVKQIITQMFDLFYNPSQPYSKSNLLKKKLKEARKIIAECINASPEEIFFTSGGTESNNTIVFQMLKYEKNNSILTSNIEHKSIIAPCNFIEKLGYKVIRVNVNSNGVVVPDLFKKCIADDTKLSSVMIVNNEIGTIQNIKSLAKIAHEKGVLFHTDAVQALGHIKIDVKELDVDFLSASAHKFNGPKGIGFLYIKNGTNFQPMIYGGMQEMNRRAGTENIPYIYGMAIALKKNINQINDNCSHLCSLYDTFINRLKIYKIDFIENSTNKGVPGLVNISLKYQNGESILHRLDFKNIFVSTGSACDSINNQISHVIKAINVDPAYSEGTIRISFGKNNTLEDAVKVADELYNIVKSNN